ncbi:hypothetical protein quinque_013932 [Culex quinquefasciatus]
MEAQRAAREASRVDIPVSDMHDLRSADAARHLNLNHFEQRADSERHGAVESPEAPGLRDRLLAVQLSLVVDPEALRTGIYETEHTRNNEVTNIKLTGDKVVAARLSGRIDFLRLETYTQGRQIDWGFTSAYRRTHIRTGSAASLSMFRTVRPTFITPRRRGCAASWSFTNRATRCR